MIANSDIYILLDRPRKIEFRFKDLRDAEGASGRSYMDLIGMESFGWSTLLFYGMRRFDAGLNPNLLAEIIETYVKQKRAEGVKLPMKEIGDRLYDALEAGGFVHRDRAEQAGPEGNAPTPMTGG